jgi:hypothetical protein
MSTYSESLKSFDLETLVLLIEDLQGQVEEGVAGAENRLNRARSVYLDLVIRNSTKETTCCFCGSRYDSHC